MKHTRHLAAALALALGMTVPAAPGLAGEPPPAKRAFPFPVRQEELSNGLRVVLVPFDSPGLVAYYTLVRVGSRNEVEPGHTGFAHLFEHMMFRGTKKYPSFDGKMAQLGWSNNAWTSDDETVYTDFGLRETLTDVIELEADRFRNLSYTEAAFRTETLAVLGEYNKNASQPWQALEEALNVTAFTAHTYRHTTMGFIEDIKAMPDKYTYSVNFLRRFYTPDNCVIVVAGDFDRDDVMGAIETYYGTWQGQAESPNVPAEPPQTEERRTRVDWPSETLPQLLIGYKAPAATDWAGSAAQDVLYAYLFGETSELHRRLVLERQIAQPFEQWTRPHRDPFLFAFLATGKDEAALPEIEKAVNAAIDEVAQGKVDTKRLARIKSNRRYALLLGLDDAESVAGFLAGWISPTGDIDAPDRFMDALDRLSAADLTDFAKKNLTRDQRTVVSLVPKQKGAEP